MREPCLFCKKKDETVFPYQFKDKINWLCDKCSKELERSLKVNASTGKPFEMKIEK